MQRGINSAQLMIYQDTPLLDLTIRLNNEI